MRQFVYEVEDEDSIDGVCKRVSETWDSKMVYRKQKPVKLLNDTPKVRTISTALRKAAITHIIK